MPKRSRGGEVNKPARVVAPTRVKEARRLSVMVWFKVPFADACVLQPEGLPAISRGLSVATPPDRDKNRSPTPAGSQQSKL